MRRGRVVRSCALQRRPHNTQGVQGARGLFPLLCASHRFLLIVVKAPVLLLLMMLMILLTIIVTPAVIMTPLGKLLTFILMPTQIRYQKLQMTLILNQWTLWMMTLTTMAMLTRILVNLMRYQVQLYNNP